MVLRKKKKKIESRSNKAFMLNNRILNPAKQTKLASLSKARAGKQQCYIMFTYRSNIRIPLLCRLLLYLHAGILKTRSESRHNEPIQAQAT